MPVMRRTRKDERDYDLSCGKGSDATGATATNATGKAVSDYGLSCEKGSDATGANATTAIMIFMSRILIKKPKKKIKVETSFD